MKYPLLALAWAPSCLAPSGGASRAPELAPDRLEAAVAPGPITRQVIGEPVGRYGEYSRTQGDANMDTESHEWTELRVTSTLLVNPTTVTARVQFYCREDDNDWSTFSGPVEEIVYVAPIGYEVGRLGSPAQYTDYRYSQHVRGERHGRFDLLAGNHWRTLKARVDSREKDDSAFVGFEGLMDFEVDIVPQSAEAVLEPVEQHGFGHVGAGDENMMTVIGGTTELQVRSELLLDANRREVLAVVFFRCREDAPDHTTFEGEVTRSVYSAPPGRRILHVYKPAQYGTFAYTDHVPGKLHEHFAVPVQSHWASLECRVDSWWWEDGVFVGFEGVLNFQVVLEPSP